MKPDPSTFPKLPSIGELLKHPAVEQMVERVNQTTIAQRATGFLEELQSNWQQRTEHGLVPTVQQLAERFARRLLGSEQGGLPVVNATGAILGDHWPTPPLADAAIHELLNTCSEYHRPHQPLDQQVADLLGELTGAEAAWVANRFSSLELLASECDGLNIDGLGYSGIIDPAEYGLPHVDTISQRLASQADLVLIEGAGLLGGPACGIALGSKSSVAQFREHPFAEALAADRLTLAALDATLRIYQSEQQPIHQIPVLQLLSTPVVNLQQRCERLAPLIEATELVASATPMQCEALWFDASNTKISGPTWAIKIEPVEDSRNSLLQRLSEAHPQIAYREQQDVLWLDLRSVFPRWDQLLVEAFE